MTDLRCPICEARPIRAKRFAHSIVNHVIESHRTLQDGDESVTYALVLGDPESHEESNLHVSLYCECEHEWGLPPGVQILSP